jgi:DNA polymerase V
MSPRGGSRPGSGRTKLEPTTVIRVPAARLQEIKSLLKQQTAQLPVFSSKVQAGFPSPADDYVEDYLDLNSKFIKNPASTFVVKATGDSMIKAGIFSGDWLLVDKSLVPKDGNIVIAALNGELTVKQLYCKNSKVQLLSANPKYQPIDISGEIDLIIWGVVTLVLHEPKH